MTSPTFEDGKDEGALRTIGEVGKALDLKPHVLRYWEQQFDLLQPLKRSGGRRYYRPEDVALVESLNDLVNVQGYTLKGAMKAITEKHASGGDDSKDGEDVNEQTSTAETPATPADAQSGSEQAREQTRQQARAFDPPQGIGADLPTELPVDGGVESFFGRPAEAATGSPDTVQGPERSEEHTS